jgi:hypothetical protein
MYDTIPLVSNAYLDASAYATCVNAPMHERKLLVEHGNYKDITANRKMGATVRRGELANFCKRSLAGVRVGAEIC